MPAMLTRRLNPLAVMKSPPRPVARLVLLSTLAVALPCARGAETYYVSQRHPDASDVNPGAAQRPFKTIRRAVELARAGDIIWVRAGIYRETLELSHSGTAEAPLRLSAWPGDHVVIRGADRVTARWRVHAGSIFVAQVAEPVTQVFVDGQVMTEARWPNQPPGRRWDRSCWASAGKGSRYGKMVDPRLASTGVDFTGAIAVLNVAHQFFTWTRPVTKHAAGSDTFEYPRDLKGITSYANKQRPWEDDRYYLFGKLEALDVAGEWFYDAANKRLYLWTPDGTNPEGHDIEIKARDYAFIARGRKHVEIRGFYCFASAFQLTDVEDVVVEACHFRFPSFARHQDEPGHQEDRVCCEISGRGNTVRDCSFAEGPTTGLRVRGPGNTIANNLLHDFCWDGSLRYQGLSLEGVGEPERDQPTVCRYNTLFNLGNAILCFQGPGQVVEYNHVYDGGLACKDVSLIYTQLPETSGNVVRYNWVHGCRTERGGGLGIRGDDQTRGLTVHHNVVWDCGRDGIIVKGDGNRVVNNTVLDIGGPRAAGQYLHLPTVPEPKKPWRKQAPLLPVQNENSLIANNAARTIIGGKARGQRYRFQKNLVTNCQERDLKLADPAGLDFRPRADSPLIDAGTVIPGITERFDGRAPDIGAYEYGGENWRPGCRNYLRLLEDTDAADGAKRLRVVLGMPPVAPVTLTGEAPSGSPQRHTFAPSEWTTPWQLRLTSDAAELTLRVEETGFRARVALGELDPVWGLRIDLLDQP
jgi:hypothetical protein